MNSGENKGNNSVSSNEQAGNVNQWSRFPIPDSSWSNKLAGSFNDTTGWESAKKVRYQGDYVDGIGKVSIAEGIQQNSGEKSNDIERNKIVDFIVQNMTPEQRAEYSAKLAEGYVLDFNVHSIPVDKVNSPVDTANDIEAKMAQTETKVMPEGIDDWKKSLSSYEDDFFSKTVESKEELAEKRRKSEGIAKKARRLGLRGMFIGLALGSLYGAVSPTRARAEEPRRLSSQEFNEMFGAPDDATNETGVDGSEEASTEQGVSNTENETSNNAVNSTENEATASGGAMLNTLGNIFDRAGETLKNTRNVIINGETVSMDLTIGGTNTGDDFRDLANKKSKYSLTTRGSRIVNEGDAYREAQNDPEKLAELTKYCLQDILDHAANIGPMGLGLARFGEFGNAVTSPEHVTAQMDELKNDSERYEKASENLQNNINNELDGAEIKLGLWNKSFASQFMYDDNGVLTFKNDNYVAPKKGGVLIMQAFKNGKNVYNEGLVKQHLLEFNKFIPEGASEAEIEEAMNRFMVVGYEVGCKQFLIVEVNYKKPDPQPNKKPDPKPQPGENPKPEDNENHGEDHHDEDYHDEKNHHDEEIHGEDHHEENHHDEEIHGEDHHDEEDHGKEDHGKEDHGEDHHDEDHGGGHEEDHGGDNGGDGGHNGGKTQELAPKTGEVRGANVDDDNQNVTDEVKEDEGTVTQAADNLNARGDDAGGEVSQKDIEQGAATQSYTQQGEDGNTNDSKTLSTVDNNTNTNLKTGSDDIPAEAGGKEVVQEDTGNTAQADSELTSADKTEWNYQDDILSDNF